MHAHQRKSTPQLDQHLGFLEGLEGFAGGWGEAGGSPGAGAGRGGATAMDLDLGLAYKKEA